MSEATRANEYVTRQEVQQMLMEQRRKLLSELGRPERPVNTTISDETSIPDDGAYDRWKGKDFDTEWPCVLVLPKSSVFIPVTTGETFDRGALESVVTALVTFDAGDEGEVQRTVLFGDYTLFGVEEKLHTYCQAFKERHDYTVTSIHLSVDA